MSRIVLPPHVADFLDQEIFNPLLLLDDKNLSPSIREQIYLIKDKMKASGGKHSTGEVILGGRQATLAMVFLGQELFHQLDRDIFSFTPAFNTYYRFFSQSADQIPGMESAEYYPESTELFPKSFPHIDIDFMKEAIELLAEKFVFDENPTYYTFSNAYERDFMLHAVQFVINDAFDSPAPYKKRFEEGKLAELPRFTLPTEDLYDLRNSIDTDSNIKTTTQLKTALEVLDFYFKTNIVNSAVEKMGRNLQSKIETIYKSPLQTIYFSIQKRAEIGEYLWERYQETHDYHYRDVALVRFKQALNALDSIPAEKLDNELISFYKELLLRIINRCDEEGLEIEAHLFRHQALASRFCLNLGLDLISSFISQEADYENEKNFRWKSAQWYLVQALWIAGKADVLPEGDLTQQIRDVLPTSAAHPHKAILNNISHRFNQMNGALLFDPEIYLNELTLFKVRSGQKVKHRTQGAFHRVVTSIFKSTSVKCYDILETNNFHEKAFFRIGNNDVTLEYNKIEKKAKLVAAKRENHQLTALSLDAEIFLGQNLRNLIQNIFKELETENMPLDQLEIGSGKKVIRVYKKHFTHEEENKMHLIAEAPKPSEDLYLPQIDDMGFIKELSRTPFEESRFKNLGLPSLKGNNSDPTWIADDIYNFKWTYLKQSISVQVQLFHQRENQEVTFHAIISPEHTVTAQDQKAYAIALARSIDVRLKEQKKSIKTLAIEVNRNLYLFDQNQTGEFILNAEMLLKRPSSWIYTLDKQQNKFENLLRLADAGVVTWSEAPPSDQKLNYIPNSSLIHYHGPKKKEEAAQASKGQTQSTPTTGASSPMLQRMRLMANNNPIIMEPSVDSPSPDANPILTKGKKYEAAFESISLQLLSKNIVIEKKEGPESYLDWFNLGKMEEGLDASQVEVVALDGASFQKIVTEIVVEYNKRLSNTELTRKRWLAFSSGRNTIYYSFDASQFMSGRFHFVKALETYEEWPLPAVNLEAPLFKEVEKKSIAHVPNQAQYEERTSALAALSEPHKPSFDPFLFMASPSTFNHFASAASFGNSSDLPSSNDTGDIMSVTKRTPTSIRRPFATKPSLRFRTKL